MSNLNEMIEKLPAILSMLFINAKNEGRSYWNALCYNCCDNKSLDKTHRYMYFLDMVLEFNKESIEEGTVLYRGRYINVRDIVRIKGFSSSQKEITGIRGYNASNSGAPTKKIKPNRCNSQNERVLYLSSTKQGACIENRPRLWDNISVADFKINKELSVIDLRVFKHQFIESKIADFFKDPRLKDDYKTQLEFVQYFEFFKSMSNVFQTPGSDDDLNYHIHPVTQLLTSYIREKGFDGIRYSGVAERDSYNLVLFNPDLADCVSEYGEVYQFDSSKSDFSNISRMINNDGVLEPNIITATAEYKPKDYNRIVELRDHYIFDKKRGK